MRSLKLFFILICVVAASHAQRTFIKDSHRKHLLDSLKKKAITLTTQKQSFMRDTLLFNTLDEYNYHFFEVSRSFDEQKRLMGFFPDSMYKIARQIAWKKGQAISLLRKADAVSYLGNKAKAIEDYLEVIKICREQNYPNTLSEALINLAICYAYRKKITPEEWTTTIKYMDEALVIAKKNSDLENIHRYYNFMGDFHVIKKRYREALVYYEAEYPVLQKHREMIGYRTNLAYLGICNLHINQEQRAWFFLNRFFQENHLDEGSYAVYLYNVVMFEIGNYYLNIKHDYKKALHYQEEYAKNLNQVPLFNVASHYESMSKIYSAMHNYKRSQLYQEKHFRAIDSLKEMQSSAKISEMLIQLESQKKEYQIKDLQNRFLLQENFSQKKGIVFIVISSIFIIGLLTLGFYLNFINKKKKESELTLVKERNEKRKEIITAQETERQRIAQDLHDEVGNSLAALKNYISQTNLELGEKINKIAQDVRNISHNLASIDFEKTTLSVAFQNLINRHNEAETIDYELIEIGIQKKLSAEKELVIYRIVCELLNNIQKHSKAKKATLQLVYETQNLTVIVEDDGIGIKTKSTVEEGIGLKHIQTRVAYINAKLTIDDDGKGTIVIINVPIST